MIKLKIIFIDRYFCYYQIPKNAENTFQKIFYAETNGTLTSNHWNSHIFENIFSLKSHNGKINLKIQ